MCGARGREASTAVDFALARFRAGDYRAIWGAPYQAAELARLRGAFHSAEESYRRAAESGWEAQPGLSLLHLALGRTARAQEEIRRSAAGADPVTRRSLLPALIEIEVAAGDPASARRALEELRHARPGTATPMLDATVATADARVLLGEGRAADALEAARAAAHAWEAVGAPYEAARSRVLAGRALRSLGEAEDARGGLRGGTRGVRRARRGTRSRRPRRADGRSPRRRPHPAGARGAAARVHGPHEPGHRREAVAEREDGRAAPRQHLRQARHLHPQPRRPPTRTRTGWSDRSGLGSGSTHNDPCAAPGEDGLFARRGARTPAPTVAIWTSR